MLGRLDLADGIDSRSIIGEIERSAGIPNTRSFPDLENSIISEYRSFFQIHHQLDLKKLLYSLIIEFWIRERTGVTWNIGHFDQILLDRSINKS